MNDKLTIIIPCYNSEKTLREAVNSCYKQGLIEPFEIVMVDDGSTDGTKELIKKIAKEHDNIKYVFHPENRGGGATRNTAVKNSTGDLIYCLDSDNILGPDSLSKMISMLHEKKCDGVGIGRSIKFDQNDVNKVVVINEFYSNLPKVKFIDLIENTFICSAYATFLQTKSSFLATNGYPEHHGFDTQGMAFRFLGSGFSLYNCPNTFEWHRFNLTNSYYLREANAGKVNYNWQDVLIENLYLFNEETQKFILSFNCSDFTKNLFDELKKRGDILKPNYLELLGTVKYTNKNKAIAPRVYIKRNSIKGFYVRIRARLKKIDIIYKIFFHLLVIKNNIIRLFTEGSERKKYYSDIQKIIKSKEIILGLEFGGIGDSLAFSTLPRLLKEKYDIDFYISSDSLKLFRNKDTYKLVFEMNPYFKGILSEKPNFKLKTFIREESWWTFFTDRNCKNTVERIEKQLNLNGKGIPEIYYKPNILKTYTNIILIDNNFITGKRLGWKYKSDAFENEAKKYLTEKDVIEYIDTKKQDLFTYVDTVYSCKRFVGTFSGGSAISACFDKSFSVIWPTNGKNSSNYQFVFKKSKGQYVN